MQVISSYKVKLQGKKAAIKNTTKIYQKAVEYLIGVTDAEWQTLSAIYDGSTQKAQSAVERMVHGTKNNPWPKYDFDGAFYKLPSYFRRAAISAALGAVSSYRSLLKNWEDAGQAGRKPKLVVKQNAMPVFFKDNMSRSDAMLIGRSENVELKLYNGSDWVWVSIPCRKQDVKYLVNHWQGVGASAPTLVAERKPAHKSAYYLRYAFEEKCTLSLRDQPLESTTVLAVDLGINTDAVCSVMKADGTVVARKFIDFPMEKDRLYHLLNRIKRLQREHGPATGGIHEWAKARRLNEDLARKISSAIIGFASLYGVNNIVFEHLDMQKKKWGSKKQRLHMWRKMDIQHRVEHQAHRRLIRVSRICAWGTSRLAFDGSGRLERNRCNHALAVFANGKQYNCDLSASYNIGARYFLREWCKSDPSLERLLPKASQRVWAHLCNLPHEV